MSPAVSETTLRRLFSVVPPRLAYERPALAVEAAFLRSAGVIGAHAAGAKLVSLTFTSAALAESLPAGFIAELRAAAREVPQGAQVRAETVITRVAAAGGRVTPLPRPGVGKCLLDQEALYLPYMLPADLESVGVLGQQWSAFAQWETADINIARDGPPTKDSDSSLKGLRDFLGYARRHHGLRPDLGLFLKGHLISDYAGFKRARGVAASTTATELKRVKKFVRWHASECAPAEAAEVAKLLADLTRLINNFDALKPGPRDVAHLREENKWLSERELVGVLLNLERRALAALCTGQTRETAQLVMDACLTGISFLHLPPMRPRDVRSLQLQLEPALPPPCLHVSHTNEHKEAGPSESCKGDLLIDR